MVLRRGRRCARSGLRPVALRCCAVPTRRSRAGGASCAARILLRRMAESCERIFFDPPRPVAGILQEQRHQPFPFQAQVKRVMAGRGMLRQPVVEIVAPRQAHQCGGQTSGIAGCKDEAGGFMRHAAQECRVVGENQRCAGGQSFIDHVRQAFGIGVARGHHDDVVLAHLLADACVGQDPPGRMPPLRPRWPARGRASAPDRRARQN